jgi:hypothetical protein
MALKKGYERLRGVAVAGAMGLGAMAGGATVRAATTATRLEVTKVYGTQAVVWENIGNSKDMHSGEKVTTTNEVVIKPTMSGFAIGGALIGTADDSDATSADLGNTMDGAFDVALTLAVNGNMFVNPDGVVDLSGDTVTANTVEDIVDGIDADVEFYFSPDRAVVRALYSLTNTTDEDITVNVLVSGNYGSDNSTNVAESQSGDDEADKTDKWYVTTDDTGDGPEDAVVTTTRYGTGASVIPTNALTPGEEDDKDYYGMRYKVTVPADSTRRVMVFHELGRTAKANADAATDFESLTALDSAGLLSGLSRTEQEEIVNYSDSDSGSSTTNGSSDDGGGGALGLPDLLIGFGLLALFRRRRSGRGDI